MSDLRRPLVALHVVWHPDSGHGPVAESLRKHFNRERFVGGIGRMGLSVSLRSVAAIGGLPAPVDFSTSQVNVAVFLAGDELAASSDWQRYLSDITEKKRRDPLACRVFPVAMTPSGQRVVPNVQAMRWHSWRGGEEERTSHLLFELTHELGRMLDAYHRHLHDPSQGASALISIDPVRVFLSHSKHDTAV